MYERVESLYRLLHAVVRFRLAKLYPDVVNISLPIPAHLLGKMSLVRNEYKEQFLIRFSYSNIICVGNLWSQNWEALIDLILPNHNAITLSLINSIKQEHHSVIKMIKEAEDFYISLGFPSLTSEFWSNSVFQQNTNKTSTCHATAINMYKKNDFRYDFFMFKIFLYLKFIYYLSIFISEFLRVWKRSRKISMSFIMRLVMYNIIWHIRISLLSLRYLICLKNLK